MSNPRLLALIAFRDEETHLPGFFSHLRDYVDGFVAFNDCSTDRSAEIACGEAKVIELLERHIPSEDHKFEIENRLALLKSARRNNADWVLCADADERFETRFLAALPSILGQPPAEVLGMHFVAAWETLKQHRVGRAKKFVLFPCGEPEPYYPKGILHQQWFPPRFYSKPSKILDYYLYHLGSMTRGERMARYEKFNRIDPDRTQQPQGYENIIDETNLVLAPITAERSFRYA